MIAYSTLGTNSMERSVAFYDAVFEAIGGRRELTTDEWVQYGRETEEGKVCLTFPHDGNKATYGNGAMLAFDAKDRSSVDAFYAVALEKSGTDAGKPGVREGTHYVAYVRDPEGNKLCVYAQK